MSFPSDIEIAQAASMLHIRDIAKKIAIDSDDLEYYGKYKAKIPLSYINEDKIKQSKLILVSAINPTPAGEGKTTVSVGLNDGLNKIGKKSIVVIREPSLGPVFGIKGGAAGGGYAQVIPMVDINLHFTGDFSAIEKANNLLSALIDNNLQNKKHNLNIDPKTIVWKRVMDMNDRSLRSIIIGVGGSGNGVMREEGFNITPASEVMAILCLSQDFEDLQIRLGNIFVGYTYDKQPVFARDLKAQGAMAILLRDAIKPNLVQTLENNPAIIHGGPFANIAQGTNTILATKMGMSLADYVVTEAGFGADLGAEKFMHIKCHYANLKPDAYVIVATVRALRYHGGAKKGEYETTGLHFVEKGIENLIKHIENAFKFGLKPIVAINHFVTDSAAEIEFITQTCNRLGVCAIVADEFTQGGNGMLQLAEEVVKATETYPNNFAPLYNILDTVEQKIKQIAIEVYGASDVVYSVKAKNQLKNIYDLGFDKWPICMAKTQKSLSDVETKIGRPTDFIITVREFEFAAGAGFIIPILGDMMRMPGLPSIPASEGMAIDKYGVITGLS